MSLPFIWGDTFIWLWISYYSVLLSQGRYISYADVGLSICENVKKTSFKRDILLAFRYHPDE